MAPVSGTVLIGVRGAAARTPASPAGPVRRASRSSRSRRRARSRSARSSTRARARSAWRAPRTHRAAPAGRLPERPVPGPPVEAAEREGSDRPRLKGRASGAAAPAGKSAGAALSRRTIRRLRANARGRFRTIGRNSSATVRGTVWLMEDRCDGTLTKVRRGRVVVRDFRRKRSITLRAGKRIWRRRPAEPARPPCRNSRALVRRPARRCNSNERGGWSWGGSLLPSSSRSTA